MKSAPPARVCAKLARDHDVSEEPSELSLAGSQPLPTAPAAAAPPRKSQKVLVARHSLLMRVTHWINAISLFFLLLSGLQIFNAHPTLYWGQASDFGHGWLAIGWPGDSTWVARGAHSP